MARHEVGHERTGVAVDLHLTAGPNARELKGQGSCSRNGEHPRRRTCAYIRHVHAERGIVEPFDEVRAAARIGNAVERDVHRAVVGVDGDVADALVERGKPLVFPCDGRPIFTEVQHAETLVLPTQPAEDGEQQAVLPLWDGRVVVVF